MQKTSEMSYFIKYNTVASHRDRNNWILSSDPPETRVRRDSAKSDRLHSLYDISSKLRPFLVFYGIEKFAYKRSGQLLDKA